MSSLINLFWVKIILCICWQPLQQRSLFLMLFEILLLNLLKHSINLDSLFLSFPLLSIFMCFWQMLICIFGIVISFLSIIISFFFISAIDDPILSFLLAHKLLANLLYTLFENECLLLDGDGTALVAGFRFLIKGFASLK